jgi:tRNA(Ile)-lysidine synthase TilS/MesJ
MTELIEIEVKSIENNASSFEVKSHEDVTKATNVIKGIKSLKERIEEVFNPIVDKAHKAHKEAIGQRDKYLKPLLETEKKIKFNILEFNKRIEAEQRERERIANEELAKIAEEQKQKLLEESRSTDSTWNAESLKEQAESIIPIVIDAQKKVINEQGLSIKKKWKARIVDFDLIPREFLIANEPLLNQLANEAKKESHIAGVEFYEESIVSVRS